MFRCRAAYCAVLAAAILFFLFFKEYLAFFTLVLILILPFFSWLFLALAARRTTAVLAAQNVTPYKNQEFSLYITLKRPLFPCSAQSCTSPA